MIARILHAVLLLAIAAVEIFAGVALIGWATEQPWRDPADYVTAFLLYLFAAALVIASVRLMRNALAAL